MKVKLKYKETLPDLKVWYIAAQLGVSNNDVRTLKGGGVIDVAQGRLTACVLSIKMHLMKVKETAATKGDKT